MKRLRIYKAVVCLLTLVCIAQIALGSFTGKADERSKKYSLRNLKNYKRFTLTTLNSNYQFKGFQTLPYSANNRYNALVKYESGNSSYVYPYKYTVKTPKFKTPSRP
jgi:hypothetical protein